MIKLINISKNYASDEVLSGVNLELADGAFLYLLGKSGTGKSTLLRILSGDDIDFAGERFAEPKKIGFLEQNSTLDPYLTLEENCGYFLDYRELPDKESHLRQILQLLELENIATSFPEELSGGELRRANLALLLCLDKQVLLLDEPTAGLEPRLSQRLLDFFEQLNQKGNTIVLVTHDWELAKQHPHPTKILKDGRLYEA